MGSVAEPDPKKPKLQTPLGYITRYEVCMAQKPYVVDLRETPQSNSKSNLFQVVALRNYGGDRTTEVAAVAR